MIWVLGNPQYMLEKTLIFGNPTRPNIKNPYPLGTDASSRRLYANLKQFYSKFKHLYAVLVLISSRQKMQWCLNLRLFHVWLWCNDTQQVNEVITK